MGIAGVSLITHLLFWVKFNEIVIVIVDYEESERQVVSWDVGRMPAVLLAF